MWTPGSSAASTEGGERLLSTSPGRSCHPWRTSTPSGVGRKATKIIKDPSHPATNCSVCCRLADGSAAFEPEPPGSGKLHTAGHKTFKLCSQHHHFLTTPPL
ncbi:hypothetical protein L3Q82_019237, partial [Scortum barcoo]